MLFRRKPTIFFIIGVTACFGVLLFVSVQTIHAQTSPQFLVTWKASNSYIPSFYQGKALPSYGSRITASFELISNGNVVDLRSQTIYWYLDQILVGGGTGAQQVTFSPLGTPPDSLSLSIQLPSYNGSLLIHTVQIPFVNPGAVIYAPYPGNNFSANPLVLKAIPFFFNASSSNQLVYSWSVNSQTGSNTENPQEADIILPSGMSSGSSLDISLNIKNPLGSITASGEKSLTYQSQL
jgi:hypothetical protein